MDNPLIIYDGVCLLCNAFVKFIIKHDRKDKFRFVPFQFSEDLNQKGERLESVLLKIKNRTFDKSTAAIRIIASLGGLFWRVLIILLLIPKPIRDFFYSIIAKNRYKLFGKANTCIIPDESIRHKFLF